jgi:hypothetical protein
MKSSMSRSRFRAITASAVSRSLRRAEHLVASVVVGVGDEVAARKRNRVSLPAQQIGERGIPGKAVAGGVRLPVVGAAVGVALADEP